MEKIEFNIFDGRKEISKSLFWYGKRSLLDGPLISIVGAREVKPWVLEWMENELGPALRKLAVGVVSGGARGVDQMAHSLAMRSDLPSIVVIPSGINCIYPKSITGWLNHKTTLFLSEYEEDQEMRKFHFYCRNKIVIGMSPLTLVVQAKERSGTMMSARFALDSGKTLATIPGAPCDPAFGGNNQLLYEGCQMVRNRFDVEALIKTHLSIETFGCSKTL